MVVARVLSLDLDDTLWPVAPVILEAEKALLDWLRTKHPRVAAGHDSTTMRALREKVALAHPERRHDLTFLRRRALLEQFKAAGYADDVGTGVDPGLIASKPVVEALELFLTHRNRVELYEDVRPALARLREKYRLFAVSNGNAELSRCGLGDIFEGHVNAANAGAAKPDARIFAHLARLARVPAGEILHVGDDPLADVLGAMNADMQSVWLNREGRVWPDGLGAAPRTITKLSELL